MLAKKQAFCGGGMWGEMGYGKKMEGWISGVFDKLKFEQSDGHLGEDGESIIRKESGAQERGLSFYLWICVPLPARYRDLPEKIQSETYQGAQYTVLGNSNDQKM